MARLQKRLFDKKTVMITGASSGIGEALAREFSRLGANLVLTARREDRLKKLAEEIHVKGGESLVVSCDVTRDGDLEKAVEQARKRFGGIDIVVANAGFGVVGPVAKLSLPDFRRQFETNVFGVLRTVYATLAELKQSGGTLVFMGSVASYVALPEAAPYAMSKFSIRALAESLRGELAPQGVSVVLISPGFVRTEIHQVDNQGRFHEKSRHGVPEWIRMPAETAAREMVRAIARKQREDIVTFHGKSAVFLQRHTPWLIELLRKRGFTSRKEPKSREKP